MRCTNYSRVFGAACRRDFRKLSKDQAVYYAAVFGYERRCVWNSKLSTRIGKPTCGEGLLPYTQCTRGYTRCKIIRRVIRTFNPPSVNYKLGASKSSVCYHTCLSFSWNVHFFCFVFFVQVKEFCLSKMFFFAVVRMRANVFKAYIMKFTRSNTMII